VGSCCGEGAFSTHRPVFPAMTCIYGPNKEEQNIVKRIAIWASLIGEEVKMCLRICRGVGSTKQINRGVAISAKSELSAVFITAYNTSCW